MSGTSLVCRTTISLYDTVVQLVRRARRRASAADTRPEPPSDAVHAMATFAPFHCAAGASHWIEGAVVSAGATPMPNGLSELTLVHNMCVAASRTVASAFHRPFTPWRTVTFAKSVS